MPRQVAPEIAGRRIVHVGNAEIQRDDVTHAALEVVAALLAAIVDLPGLLVVVAGDGRGGPDVSIAGNFAAVVEVVEDAELPRQLVLVGRDVFAVHHQRRIAVGLADVAEELVVGAVFLDDVDDVVNRIAAALEADLAGAAFHQVAAHDLLRQASRDRAPRRASSPAQSSRESWRRCTDGAACPDAPDSLPSRHSGPCLCLCRSR